MVSFYSNIPRKNLIYMQMAIANNNAPMIIQDKAYWADGTYTPLAVAVYREACYIMQNSVENAFSDYREMINDD